MFLLIWRAQASSYKRGPVVMLIGTTKETAYFQSNKPFLLSIEKFELKKNSPAALIQVELESRKKYKNYSIES